MLSRLFSYSKVLNVLFMPVLSKIYLVVTINNWHGVYVHDGDLPNRHSATAVLRPHVTPETMIDNKFLCYTNTVKKDH